MTEIVVLATIAAEVTAAELPTTPDALRARIHRDADFARLFQKVGARCYVASRAMIPAIVGFLKSKKSVASVASA